jgi:hypothetical protein
MSSLQRCIDTFHDPAAGQADGVLGAVPGGIARAHLHADLGQDRHLRPGAAGGQPLADDRLGLAALVARHPGGIDIGGVDAGQPDIDQPVEDTEGRRLFQRPAEDIATEDDGRDGDAAAPQIAVLHDVSPRARAQDAGGGINGPASPRRGARDG